MGHTDVCVACGHGDFLERHDDSCACPVGCHGNTPATYQRIHETFVAMEREYLRVHGPEQRPIAVAIAVMVLNPDQRVSTAVQSVIAEGLMWNGRSVMTDRAARADLLRELGQCLCRYAEDIRRLRHLVPVGPVKSHGDS